MNANELADLYDAPYEYPEWGSKAQDMLRQQQALINQLEETQDYLYKTHDADKAEIDFLKKEILAKHEDWKHEGQQASNARAEIEALKSVVYWLKENRPEVWDDIQKWRKQ